MTTAVQLAITPALSTVRRQALRHFGSKASIAPWILSHFPEHTTYTEVYGGGYGVGQYKFPSETEVYNDLNGGSVNFWRVLQTQPEALISALQRTEVKPENFSGSTFLGESQDPVEWARRYTAIAWGSFMGAGGRWSGGCSAERLDRMGDMDWSFLLPISQRIQGLIIQQGDALAALQMWDTPQTLHYVDPPYPAEARKGQDKRHKSGGAPRRQYACEMLKPQQHREMAAVLKQLTGFVILSGRRCPLYDELFQGWRTVSTGYRDTSRTTANEVLWMNF